MDIFEKLLGVIAALLGLAAAIYTYRQVRRETHAKPSPSSITLVTLAREPKAYKSLEPLPWYSSTPKQVTTTILRTIILILIITSFALAAAIYYFREALFSPSLDYFSLALSIYFYVFVIVGAIRFVSWIALFFAYRKKQKASTDKVSRAQAEIVVIADNDRSLQAHCIAALKAINGATILEVNSDSGIIKARAVYPSVTKRVLLGTPPSYHDITVTMQKMEEVRTSHKAEGAMKITIESVDSGPFADPDAEENQDLKNVDRFVVDLVG